MKVPQNPFNSHKVEVKPYQGKLLPEILCHPNIPKPLHGIAPRTIKGQAWWDIERKAAYAKTNYHCIACGTHASKNPYHKWLEAHEFWNINYQTGKCEITSIEPLCHSCHNFIHSGRLSMIIGREKTKKAVIDILEHGFNVLSRNNLECFPFTLEFAKKLGANTYDVKAYDLKVNDKLKWKDYVLIFDGQEYKSKFESMEEWAQYYS